MSQETGTAPEKDPQPGKTPAWEIFVSFLKKAWPQLLAGALMAAPVYFDIPRYTAGLIFWGLGVLGVIGMCIEVYLEISRGSSSKYRTASWLGIMFGALVLGVAAWHFWPTNLSSPAQQSEAKGRVLADAQKERMRLSMKMAPDEHFYFSINSGPGCDECDVFADDLRQFVATIPGWKVDGGVMVFPDPSRHRGLWLTYRSSDARLPAVQKVLNAFQDAGMPLQSEINEDLRPPGSFILGVYRPGP